MAVGGIEVIDPQEEADPTGCLITDNDEAAELLALAPSQSPDEFAKTVDQYRIDRDAKGWRDRQQKARSVKFFKADNGCVGIRAILPTLEGEQVKAAINEACDTAWRAAHPDRAETLGGHDAEPREQRLADALVVIIAGTTATGSARTALIVSSRNPRNTSARRRPDPHPRRPQTRR